MYLFESHNLPSLWENIMINDYNNQQITEFVNYITSANQSKWLRNQENMKGYFSK